VFKQGFLNVDKSQTTERLRNFQELCRCWNNCPEIEAYKALKRIKVKTVDEDTLRTIVESRLAALVEGESATVADVLAQYALDKVHYELTALDIWHHLENRDEPFRRREWGKDPHVLAAVNKVNDRYLDRLHKEAIAGKVIPRDEVNLILDKLTSPEGKLGVLVAGEAGVGKSGVILQAVEALRQKGVPIIAFRVDVLKFDKSCFMSVMRNAIAILPTSKLCSLALTSDFT
jgi:ATP-dependent Clp protease ATP-binding subunit ClpA